MQQFITMVALKYPTITFHPGYETSFQPDAECCFGIILRFHPGRRNRWVQVELGDDGVHSGWRKRVAFSKCR